MSHFGLETALLLCFCALWSFICSIASTLFLILTRLLSIIISCTYPGIITLSFRSFTYMALIAILLAQYYICVTLQTYAYCHAHVHYVGTSGSHIMARKPSAKHS